MAAGAAFIKRHAADLNFLSRQAARSGELVRTTGDPLLTVNPTRRQHCTKQLSAAAARLIIYRAFPDTWRVHELYFEP